MRSIEAVPLVHMQGPEKRFAPVTGFDLLSKTGA